MSHDNLKFVANKGDKQKTFLLSLQYLLKSGHKIGLNMIAR